MESVCLPLWFISLNWISITVFSFEVFIPFSYIFTISISFFSTKRGIAHTHKEAGVKFNAALKIGCMGTETITQKLSLRGRRGCIYMNIM